MSFFGFGKQSKETVMKSGKKLAVENPDWSKYRYYTKGKKNASIVKKNRSNGKTTKTNVTFTRDPNYLYFVNKNGELKRTQRVNV